MISTLNSNDLVNMVNERYSPVEASEKQVSSKIEVTQLISDSIVYSVRMIKLFGLPEFLLKIVPSYQNLFKNLRLITYDEISSENSKKNYEEENTSKLEHLLNQMVSILKSKEFVFISYESKVIEILMAMVMNSYDELTMQDIVQKAISIFLRILELKDNNSENWLKLANKCLGFLILSNYEIFSDNKTKIEGLIKESLTAGGEEVAILKNLLGYNEKIISDESELQKALDDCSTKYVKLNDEGKMKEEKEEIDMAEESTENPSKIEGKQDELKQAMKSLTKKKAEEIRSLLENIPRADAVLQKYLENYTFQLIDLNENFNEIYQHYIYSTCDKCGNRPNKTDFGLCLLSGVVLCTRECENNRVPLGKSHSLLI